MAGLLSVAQGTSNKYLALPGGTGAQRGGFCFRREREPVDYRRGERAIARLACVKIDENHHAAARGSCLPVHGATFAQGSASVLQNPIAASWVNR